MNQTKYIIPVLLLFSISHVAPANTIEEKPIETSSTQDSPVEALEFHAGDIKTKQLKAQAKQRIKVFSTKLKTALLGAVQDKGFKHAVSVCKEQAPLIAQDLSTDGWTIARTSVKVRNAKNTASDWEQEMLEQFDRRFKAGDLASSLHASTVKDGDYKYVQAIPTGELCLACHGKSLEPALLQHIQSHYPKDKATGFTLKDIRGAFIVTKSSIRVSE